MEIVSNNKYLSLNIAWIYAFHIIFLELQALSIPGVRMGRKLLIIIDELSNIW